MGWDQAERMLLEVNDRINWNRITALAALMRERIDRMPAHRRNGPDADLAWETVREALEEEYFRLLPGLKPCVVRAFGVDEEIMQSWQDWISRMIETCEEEGDVNVDAIRKNHRLTDAEGSVIDYDELLAKMRRSRKKEFREFALSAAAMAGGPACRGFARAGGGKSLGGGYGNRL